MEMKAREERPQEFRPTGKRGLKCDGPRAVVGWGGKRERKRGREWKGNEREGGSEGIRKERATDKSTQTTAGEKEEEGNEIERSGRRT
jgi:hypothetical protein